MHVNTTSSSSSSLRVYFFRTFVRFIHLRQSIATRSRCALSSMQQYKFIHELSATEFAKLVTIIEDYDSMKWLSSGHARDGWSRARLEELREYSRTDSRPSFRTLTRKYYFWAILVEGAVAGMIGIHPVPMTVTNAILRHDGGIGIPIRSQFMFVIARGYRGRGVASRALTEMSREHPHVCVVIRADNMAAIRSMMNVRAYTRVMSQDVAIDDTPVVVYTPTRASTSTVVSTSN